MGESAVAEHRLQILLGAALIIGAVSMLLRSLVASSRHPNGDILVRRAVTVAIGAVGGFMVGLTSVGAGSLIVVLLVFIYPNLRNDQLVGTDLAQSVPLTLSATLGTLLFSHVDFSLTTSIIVGSVPAVIIGALLSSRSNGLLLRRIIMGAVLVSGLKYVGFTTDALGVAAVVVAAGVTVLSVRELRRGKDDSLVAEPVQDVVALLPTWLDSDA
jgi:uncharacterized membrane protein YfcA